ncbi:MAG: triose-phosphate isomerase [Bacilli bacterium]|nr:triose-phosphate isomerase [Bacilli bacterium]
MIVALNNKCNLGKEEFIKYLEELNNIKTTHQMILAPTFINIPNVKTRTLDLAAQNVSCDTNGAHTGEVSADQLKSYGVKYCIVGHSERREKQRETNEEIKLKIEKLFDQDIIPILCCGETKEERLEGKEKEIIEEELRIALDSLDKEKKDKVIIAYEPIWSIGTGLIPTNEQIEEINNFIKSKYNNKVLYGGSANDSNIDELKKCKTIDGYLLGGLSLKPSNLQDFVNKL